MKDGIVKPGSVLKVDSFLGHQMDIALTEEIGKESKRPLPETICRVFYALKRKFSKQAGVFPGCSNTTAKNSILQKIIVENYHLWKYNIWLWNSI